MGAPTADAGNMSNGTTSIPRLGRGLMAGLFADSPSLTLVLSNTL